MKNSVLVIGLFASLNAFASFSVEGNTSQAPWIYSQTATKMVLDYAQKKQLAIESIAVSGNEVILKSSCYNGSSSETVFAIESRCKKNAVYNCVPQAQLVLMQTQSCQ